MSLMINLNDVRFVTFSKGRKVKKHYDWTITCFGVPLHGFQKYPVGLLLKSLLLEFAFPYLNIFWPFFKIALISEICVSDNFTSKTQKSPSQQQKYLSVEMCFSLYFAPVNFIPFLKYSSQMLSKILKPFSFNASENGVRALFSWH